MSNPAQMGPIEFRWDYLKNYRYDAKGISKPCISVHTEDKELHDHPSMIFPGFRFELVYVTSGDAIHITENTETPIRTGDCIIIDNGVRHGFRLIEGKPLSVMESSFEYSLIDDTPSRFKTLTEIAKHNMIIASYESPKPIESFVFHDGDGAVLKIFNEILGEHEAKRPGYQAMVKYKTLEIILFGLRSYFEKKMPENYSPPIKKIIDYMNYGYMSNIPLKDFAKNLNIPFRSLSRQFQREVGVSYTKYVQERKISESYNLLTESDESVEYIAQSVGFSDSKQFREKFKELTGMTPREYRKYYTSPGEESLLKR